MATIKSIVYILNTPDFFLSHRKDLALKAKESGYHVSVITPYNEILSEKIKNLGFIYHPFNMTRKGLNPLSEIIRIVQFYFLLKKIKPDIVHAFTPKPILYSCVVNLFIKYNLVISFTGLGHVYTENSIKIKTIRLVVKSIFRFCFLFIKPRIVFQNPDDQKLFQDFKIISSQKTIIIPGTGVNTNRFIVKDENQNPIIVFPARFLKDKGLVELIEACKILEYKKINFELWLMGKVDHGNPSSVSDSEFNEIKKSNFIKKIEYSQNMEQVLSKAQVVCLPSYREGIPLALIEAAACGRAIVTTDVPGCRSVVENRVNGLLVPVKTIEPLAKALEELLSNSDLRKKMEISSRQKALNEFDQKLILNENIELYN